MVLGAVATDGFLSAAVGSQVAEMEAAVALGRVAVSLLRGKQLTIKADSPLEGIVGRCGVEEVDNDRGVALGAVNPRVQPLDSVDAVVSCFEDVAVGASEVAEVLAFPVREVVLGGNSMNNDRVSAIT